MNAMSETPPQQMDENDDGSLSNRRTLKSYRTMKHRSISEVAYTSEKPREVMEPQVLSSARPRLRRRTRIVSCPAQDGVWAHARYGPSAQHFRRRCVSDGFWETQVKDPVSTDTEDNCSDSLYITAQSHFTEPVVEQFKTIMQVLDAESGVIERICKGSGCEIPPSQTGVENLISQGNNVTCQPVLPHPFLHLRCLLLLSSFLSHR